MKVHSANNALQNSVRVLLAMAAMFGSLFWSHYVSKVYFQAGDSLVRESYVRPPDEFQLSPGQFLKLLKPL